MPPLGTGIGRIDEEDSELAMRGRLLFPLGEGQPPPDMRIVTGSEYERRVFERLVAEMTSRRSAPEY